MESRRGQEAPTECGKENGPKWAPEDVLGGTVGISMACAVEGLEESDSGDGAMVKQLRTQAKIVSEQLQAHVIQQIAPLIEQPIKSKDN